MEFPYWLHFVEKEGETLLHLFRLLCRGHIVRHDQEPGMVGWRFDDLREFDRQLRLFFNAMNDLYDSLALPEALNQRVSEEVMQLIENTLQSD